MTTNPDKQIPSLDAHAVLIDTHCHLEMSAFDPDRSEVIERAKRAGVAAMITIGSDYESNFNAVKIAEGNDGIYAAVGIHPHDASAYNDEIHGRISDLCKRPKVVAVGETGLDYHYDRSPRDKQREVFKRHLALALDMNLPAVIHSRESEEDTMLIIRDSGLRRGVLHCFSGDIKMAEDAIGMGLYISIAGPVTFKKSSPLRDVVKIIPDDRLLIETDAPYLTPVPFRGGRNEPAYVVHTARAVAEIRGIALEDVARMTTLNARGLFNIGGIAGEGVIAYKIRNSLYLNLTNRCTNACPFCARSASYFVKGHNLRLDHEPSIDDLMAEIKAPSIYDEVVFCGFGEPTIRLDAVKAVAGWVKGKGGRTRLNTNGHGNLINNRNILPELKGLIDTVSVSLNAQDKETYDRLCAPAFEGAYEAVLSFIKEAPRYIPSVVATVVETEGVDVAACRRIAEESGAKLRVRELDIVG